MPPANTTFKYGYDDQLLCAWLDLVAELLHRYNIPTPKGVEPGTRAENIRTKKEALWEKTRVTKLADCESGLQRFVVRNDLSVDELTLIVALLYEQLEEAVGGCVRLHLDALFEGTANASSLLRFLQFFDHEGNLRKRRLISRAGFGTNRPVLTPEAFGQLLGLKKKKHGEESKRPSSPAKYLCNTFTPRVRLSDVVLTADTREEIEDALFFVQHRDAILADTGLVDRMEKGTGVALLFHGPPGTGKTMTAEAFAAELAKNVSVVRPEAVESKYVGETEKHIAALFEVARREELILIFDECDSFFYARPSGNLYQDTFAGRHVNMLLRGIEESEGVVILTTNRADTLDPALERRLAAKVHFPIPDKDARSELWRRMLPQGHELNDVEISDLAEERRLTGGQIKQAILTAVRRATRLGQKTSRSHLEAAVNCVETQSVKIGF